MDKFKPIDLIDIIDSERHWSCGRAMAKYKGSYPLGFLERLNKRISLYNKKVLSLFCGISVFGDTLDIKPELNPTYIADARNKFPILDNTYDVIIADPPYDSQNITYSNKLYNTDLIKPYSFVKESVRILKPGGYLCILHQLVYLTPKGTFIYTVIPITSGPNLRIRVLNIFIKNEAENKINFKNNQNK